MLASKRGAASVAANPKGSINFGEYVSIQSVFTDAGLPDMSQYLTDDDVSIFSLTLLALTNSAQWRALLGAAASGTNNDITQLLAFTGPLAVTQGGTGVTTLAALAAELGIVPLATAPTQTGSFVLTTEFGYWPVNLAGAYVVTLPTPTADFDVTIKAISETGSISHTLSLSSPVDGVTTVIASAGGFVRLYYSSTLGTWSIVG